VAEKKIQLFEGEEEKKEKRNMKDLKKNILRDKIED
jgi:hypothetical protein